MKKTISFIIIMVLVFNSIGPVALAASNRNILRDSSNDDFSINAYETKDNYIIYLSKNKHQSISKYDTNTIGIAEEKIIIPKDTEDMTFTIISNGISTIYDATDYIIEEESNQTYSSRGTLPGPEWDYIKNFNVYGDIVKYYEGEWIGEGIVKRTFTFSENPTVSIVLGVLVTAFKAYLAAQTIGISLLAEAIVDTLVIYYLHSGYLHFSRLYTEAKIVYEGRLAILDQTNEGYYLYKGQPFALVRADNDDVINVNYDFEPIIGPDHSNYFTKDYHFVDYAYYEITHGRSNY
ncbi:hypothetical protein [Brassicibacter mesophilus]|uniref:hypothetical protein n=1 Tax=Brassicibacter mesophilus TaxID=745119 RepID=UPI003D1A30A1